jgi:hypothetical protein
LRSRELERARLARELESLTKRRDFGQVRAPELRGALTARLTDWRGLLHRHTPQARQIVRKLLKGRLVFQPETQAGCDGYRFRGEGALD